MGKRILPHLRTRKGICRTQRWSRNHKESITMEGKEMFKVVYENSLGETKEIMFDDLMDAIIVAEAIDGKVKI